MGRGTHPRGQAGRTSSAGGGPAPKGIVLAHGGGGSAFTDRESATPARAPSKGTSAGPRRLPVRAVTRHPAGLLRLPFQGGAAHGSPRFQDSLQRRGPAQSRL